PARRRGRMRPPLSRRGGAPERDPRRVRPWDTGALSSARGLTAGTGLSVPVPERPTGTGAGRVEPCRAVSSRVDRFSGSAVQPEDFAGLLRRGRAAAVDRGDLDQFRDELVVAPGDRAVGAVEAVLEADPCGVTAHGDAERRPREVV